MDAEEREICDYLKSWSGQWVAAKEIARRAGGKRRYREDPNWSAEPLARLLDKSIVEADATGHYRLAAKEKVGRQKRWISPQIKKLLEKTGKDFEQGAQLDAP